MTLLASWSISGSSSAPMLIWMETPSAPIFKALSTEQTKIFLSGSGAKLVAPDKCIIKPISLPYRRCPAPTMPECIRTALAPPRATLSTISAISSSPLMVPIVRP